MDSSPPVCAADVSSAEINAVSQSTSTTTQTAFAAAVSASPTPNNIALLFRTDLRLHDNPALCEAVRNASSLLPLYCFDTRVITTDPFCPSYRHRARFLLDSIHDLRISLQIKGSNLIVRVGHTEDLLPQLCQEHNIYAVYTQREEDDFEYVHMKLLRKALNHCGVALHVIPGNALYEERDLPFDISSATILWRSAFRRRVRNATVRNPLPVPASIPPLPNSPSPGTVPTLAALGFQGVPVIAHGSENLEDMTGGETEALRRLAVHLEFLSQQAHLAVVSQLDFTNDPQDFGRDVTEWLSIGCISPRKIFCDVRNTVSRAYTVNSRTYFTLVTRDYQLYKATKYIRHRHQLVARERTEAKKAASTKRRDAGSGPFRAFERL